jgi:hypothetical protein
MSGYLTYLMRTEIDQAKREVDGTTLTRPSLLITDGQALTYGVDVDIGAKSIDNSTGNEVVAPLRNVPIAAANKDLIYTDVGSAVRLRRSDSGRWEVVGFSKRRVGSYTRVGVFIPEPGFDPILYTIQSPVNIGLVARPLSYDELITYGGYGVVPYGATGIFRDGALIELR